MLLPIFIQEILRSSYFKNIGISGGLDSTLALLVAVEAMREKYSIPIIGIEPAVKPAVSIGKSTTEAEGNFPNDGRIPRVLVLATPMTIREEKFKTLMNRYTDQGEIIPLPCPGLMDYVERGDLHSPDFRKYLEELLYEYTQDKVDAVIVDADIKSGLSGNEDQYDGLVELSYICNKSNIPFYLISKVERDKMLVHRRILSYFTEDDKKRFFRDGIDNFKKLLESMQHELETSVSDDSLLRNKYGEFYIAAEWLDSQRPGMNFALNVTKELKADINSSQEEMDKTVNNIRILTQNIIEWLQEVNLAPARLDPGAVAIMLRDKVHGDYIYPEQKIMDESLASMIATLYKIGNDGSHKFLFTDLYRRTAVLSLMALVQWAHKNRDLFTKQHEGFYISKSAIEVREFEDVVLVDNSRGEAYYYTRNVHLGVGKIINIQAGDRVRVSGYVYDTKNRRDDLGVIYYSDTKNWKKTN